MLNRWTANAVIFVIQNPRLSAINFIDIYFYCGPVKSVRYSVNVPFFGTVGDFSCRSVNAVRFTVDIPVIRAVIDRAAFDSRSVNAVNYSF